MWKRWPNRASLSACVSNNRSQASPGLERERSQPERGFPRAMPDTSPPAETLELDTILLAESSAFDLLTLISFAIHSVKAVLILAGGKPTPQAPLPAVE